MEWAEKTLAEHSPEVGFCETPDFYEEMDKKLISEELERQLWTLTDREQKVIQGLYLQGMKAKELAETLGIGRERVRQIASKALRKLRHPLRADKLFAMWTCQTYEEIERRKREKEEEREREREAQREKERLDHIEWVKNEPIKRAREVEKRKRIAQREREKWLAKNEEHARTYEACRQARIRDHEANQEAYKKNREANKEQEERDKVEYLKYRQKAIDQHEKEQVAKAKKLAIEAVKRKKNERTNESLLRQLEEQGEDYDGEDIPDPPEYVKLQKDDDGKYYLGVTEDRHFNTSQEIYNYWLLMLIQREKDNVGNS